MADLSVIEWVTYGIPAYGAILMLVISMIRDIPATRAQSAIRLFFCIPGMVAAAMLAPAGPHITTLTKLANSTITVINGSTGSMLTNSTTITSEVGFFVLSGPIWYYFHWMIFIVLLVYFVTQLMMLFTKPE